MLQLEQIICYIRWRTSLTSPISEKLHNAVYQAVKLDELLLPFFHHNLNPDKVGYLRPKIIAQRLLNAHEEEIERRSQGRRLNQDHR